MPLRGPQVSAVPLDARKDGMNHNATVLAPVVLAGVITGLSSGAAVCAGFERVLDDGSDRIEAMFPCGTSRRCTVSRVTVQRPNYDGPPGYTAILVTSEQVPGPGVWKEELTVFVRGQYRLLGVDAEQHRVMCYETAQRGVAGTIVNLVVFDPEHRNGEIIGPKGAYQYVSCGDDGHYCVLVGSSVTIVDMRSGTSRRMPSPEPVPSNAADPPHDTERGYWIGGGYNLSGEFVEMLWEDSTSGTLIVRNQAGETAIQVPVVWEAGG